MSVWIFKDLTRARGKGIQGEKKMQCKHSSDSEGRCNQRRPGLYQIKSKFTGSRDCIGSNKISGKKFFFVCFFSNLFFYFFHSLCLHNCLPSKRRDRAG